MKNTPEEIWFDDENLLIALAWLEAKHMPVCHLRMTDGTVHRDRRIRLGFGDEAGSYFLIDMFAKSDMIVVKAEDIAAIAVFEERSWNRPGTPVCAKALVGRPGTPALFYLTYEPIGRSRR